MKAMWTATGILVDLALHAFGAVCAYCMIGLCANSRHGGASTDELAQGIVNGWNHITEQE